MKSNIYKTIELYGVKPAFTVNTHSRYSNILDHIISAFTILLIIVFTVFYFLELLQKKNPIIISSVYNDINPLKIDINNNDFIIAIGLQDVNYINYINESIYSLEGYLVNVIKNNTHPIGEIYKIPIELTTCDNEIMPVLTNYFQKLPLKKLYCIKNKTNLFIEGTFDVNSWTYLEFSFRKCNNLTLNKEGKLSKCASTEEIEAALGEGYFSYFMSDYHTLPNDYDQPVQMFGKNFFSSINYNLFKEVWTFIKYVQLETDNAWLFSNNITRKFWSYDREMISLNINNNNHDDFLHFYIRSSENREIISRTYIKLDLVIAKSVSVGFCVYKVIGFFMYYSQKMMYKSFISTFYKMDNPFYSKNNHSKKQTSNISSHNITNNVQLMSLHNLILVNNNCHVPNEHIFQKNTKQDSQKTNKIRKSKTITHQKFEFLKDQSNKMELLKDHSNKNLLQEINTNNDLKNNELRLSSIHNNGIQCSLFNKEFPISTIQQFDEFKDYVSLSKNQNKIIQLDNLSSVLKKKKLETQKNSPLGCVDMLKFCICNINKIYQLKAISQGYKNIGIYFEVVRFLKLYNDLDLLKKLLLTESQYRLIDHDYSFYKNSDVTYTHFRTKYTTKKRMSGKLTLSNLILQSSI